jgi:uncharacterized protein (DUF433 family)
MTPRISTHPQIHFGKPCVSGTRIPVESVLELVREGLSSEAIRKDYYRTLTDEDVKACVQFAIDSVA